MPDNAETGQVGTTTNISGNRTSGSCRKIYGTIGVVRLQQRQ